MNKIYQVREEDLDYHPTLSKNDVGKFYIIINGCIMGFWDTLEEAENSPWAKVIGKQ